MRSCFWHNGLRAGESKPCCNLFLRLFENFLPHNQPKVLNLMATLVCTEEAELVPSSTCAEASFRAMERNLVDVCNDIACMWYVCCM